MARKWLTQQDVTQAFKNAWDAWAWDAANQDEFLYLYGEYESLKLDLSEQKYRARARAQRSTARYLCRPAMRRHGTGVAKAAPGSKAPRRKRVMVNPEHLSIAPSTGSGMPDLFSTGAG